jgi:hypothetical protein
LGADTDCVLSTLGFTRDQVDELRRKAAI